MPVICLGISLDGIPSIIFDNYQGIQETCSHLIEEHNLRRIAFICGTEGHDDARQRLKAYQSALAAYNIPPAPDLILPGYI